MEWIWISKVAKLSHIKPSEHLVTALLHKLETKQWRDGREVFKRKVTKYSEWFPFHSRHWYRVIRLKDSFVSAFRHPYKCFSEKRQSDLPSLPPSSPLLSSIYSWWTFTSQHGKLLKFVTGRKYTEIKLCNFCFLLYLLSLSMASFTVVTVIFWL